MKNKILISLVTSFLLFGCGGGASLDSKPSKDIVANKIGTIVVVEGMKKDIILSSDRENARFEFADKENIPNGTELSRYSGRLIFRALQGRESVENVIVRAVDDGGWKSKDLTLVFKTVSSNEVVPKKYIKTSANDSGTGLERTFVQMEDDYIKDPFGNVWENNISGKLAEPKMYILSELRCEILRQTNKNSNWRVPTADELLNLVDYGKEFGTNMYDNKFDEINLTTWAKTDDGDELIFSPLNGLIFNANITDKYPIRCINAPENKTNHVVSTDRFDDITYDFSTGLKWSPVSKDLYRIDQNGSNYCVDGWRLPSINEVRSVVENGSISTFIAGAEKYTVVPSATMVNDSNLSQKARHYAYIISDGVAKIGISYIETLRRLSCVKEIGN